ncbi:hypothetical protein B0I35DRAFT_30916 [Stachybotrys elegans]|uniref:Uncharacterized protein n=1 Tax=Stachybotrys elegans TaxID=80388 RepID=A0A8K0T1T1_9HYPO|nr:hypothetical protein B0I35DRAFT_30916 [Stachybotrys elegans]
MEASSQQTSTLEGVMPKTNSQHTNSNSPPPAYTPGRSLNLTSLTARHIQQQQQQLFQHDSVNADGRPLWTTLLSSSDLQDEEEPVEDRDSICLRINTSINVTKSNNLVCLTETPAEHANAIARAVVEAMQKNSSGQCGIPMIDEDGHPRPIRIEVDASMSVDGIGNVVGSERIISQVLEERNSRKRQRAADDEAGPANKRQHSSE